VVSGARAAEAALDELLADPTRRRSMAEASRARVEAELTYDILAERLRAAIEAACG